MATFNVLGHSHTAGGSNKPAMAASGPRMQATAQLLRRLQIDVVALQELEHPQEVLFRSTTTGWSLFRGSHAEAVAWRDDAFAHLRSWTVPIPYVDGAVRRIPVVALRHRDTGDSVIVTSFHNPASVRRWGNQQRLRDEATRREVALADQSGAAVTAFSSWAT